MPFSCRALKKRRHDSSWAFDRKPPSYSEERFRHLLSDQHMNELGELTGSCWTFILLMNITACSKSLLCKKIWSVQSGIRKNWGEHPDGAELRYQKMVTKLSLLQLPALFPNSRLWTNKPWRLVFLSTISFSIALGLITACVGQCYTTSIGTSV